MSAPASLLIRDPDDDLSPRLIRSIIACSTLAGLALAGRVVSRKIIRSKFLVSDYVVMAALATAWAMSGMTIDGE